MGLLVDQVVLPVQVLSMGMLILQAMGLVLVVVGISKCIKCLRIRKEQNLKLFGLQIIAGIGGMLWDLAVFSEISNENYVFGMSCHHSAKLMSLWFILARFGLYFFLIEKAKTVKFESSKKLIYILYVLMVIAMGNMIAHLIFTRGDVILFDGNQWVCKVSFSSITLFLSGAADINVTLGCLYAFIVPLNEIIKSSNAQSNDILKNLAKKNFRFALVSVCCTLFASGILGLVNLITDNYAIHVLASLLICWDCLANNIIMLLATKNAWETNLGTNASTITASA